MTTSWVNNRDPDKGRDDCRGAGANCGVMEIFVLLCVFIVAVVALE